MPQRLRDCLDHVASGLLAARQVLLFSDFDGTLVPIQDRPETCRLDPMVGKLLLELAELDGVKVGIVSGRDLDDLRERVGVEGLAYAGNHGLEIEGPGCSFREPLAARLIPEINTILESLGPAVTATPGAWIERKRFTASIHFRQVDAARVPALLDAVRCIFAPAVAAQNVVLRLGKMVLEIRPTADWNKGHAVNWLIERMSSPGATPMLIYFGDDETDEDAFNVLPGQITVCVGEKPDTSANYLASSPAEVHSFLNWMLCVMRR